MSTPITSRQSEILDRVQETLGMAARELLPADQASEFEAHMAADRASRFSEPETDEEREARDRHNEATYTFLQQLDTPQEVLDRFRAGDLIAHVGIELTPA